MANVDNLIIIGLVDGLTHKQVGISDTDDTVVISREIAVRCDFFLPKLLVEAGIFTSTSEIRRINDQRMKSDKIKDPREKNLWRTLDKPEATPIKVGKKVFWLFVGEI